MIYWWQRVRSWWC